MSADYMSNVYLIYFSADRFRCARKLPRSGDMCNDEVEMSDQSRESIFVT
ncbi:Uncharacterised protein [Mycobacteroides abscessus subsp. abscessus]|nr:Uncharacterised protein [Mycobacteroides abscessus subsp. abscessus]